MVEGQVQFLDGGDGDVGCVLGVGGDSGLGGHYKYQDGSRGNVWGQEVRFSTRGLVCSWFEVSFLLDVFFWM